MGTPVDPVPGIVKAALSAAADSPGYPAAHGRSSCARPRRAGWPAATGSRVDPGAVLPVIGTKEFIAALPGLLGCGQGDVVVYPGAGLPDL